MMGASNPETDPMTASGYVPRAVKLAGLAPLALVTLHRSRDSFDFDIQIM